MFSLEFLVGVDLTGRFDVPVCCYASYRHVCVSYRLDVHVCVPYKHDVFMCMSYRLDVPMCAMLT